MAEGDPGTEPGAASSDADRRIMRRGLRLLWASVRTQSTPFAVALVGAVVFACMAVGGTIVLGRVTDDVLTPAFDATGPDGGPGVPGSTIAIGAIAIVVASLLRMAGVLLRRYFGNMAQRRMQRHWFTLVTDRYLAVPLRWFDTRPAGELLAHADADAERATMALQPLPFSLGVIVITVVSMVQLALVDPVLLAVGVLLFPSLTLLNNAYTRRVEGPAARTQARVGEVSAVAHESFEAVLVVKTLGLEEREVGRLHDAAQGLRSARLEVGRLRAGFEPGLDALPNLGTVLVLWLGAWRVSSGSLTTGELVQAMALFSILAFPFRIVGFLLEELPRAVVAHDRVARVLAAPDRATPADPRPLPPGPLEVVVDAVSFAYASHDGGNPAEPVLVDVSTRLEPGTVVALVGSTGSGKSTLCQLLAHLADPDVGEIRLGGVPLTEATPADLAAATALVFQETFLFADTVRENLALGADVPEEELWRALDVARARTFVERLPHGLDEVVGERGVTLSGGQRQRLALARALLRHPRLLLLDDATSAVDPLVEQAILAGLRTAEADRTQSTTLVVAHRVSTIALADRVLLLEGGRIAAEGTHDELLAVPSYAALVRAYEHQDDAVDHEPEEQPA